MNSINLVGLRSVVDALFAMDDVFKSGRSHEDIENLAAFWLDVFSDVPVPVFEAAVQETIRRETYFPVPVKVKGYCDDIQRRIDMGAASRGASRQLGMDVLTKKQVRALFIEKGLRDDDGNWIRRPLKVAEKNKPTHLKGKSVYHPDSFPFGSGLGK